MQKNLSFKSQILYSGAIIKLLVNDSDALIKIKHKYKMYRLIKIFISYFTTSVKKN